jgi:hypothetical protein
MRHFALLIVMCQMLFLWWRNNQCCCCCRQLGGFTIHGNRRVGATCDTRYLVATVFIGDGRR